MRIVADVGVDAQQRGVAVLRGVEVELAGERRDHFLARVDARAGGQAIVAADGQQALVGVVHVLLALDEGRGLGDARHRHRDLGAQRRRVGVGGGAVHRVRARAILHVARAHLQLGAVGQRLFHAHEKAVAAVAGGGVAGADGVHHQARLVAQLVGRLRVGLVAALGDGR